MDLLQFFTYLRQYNADVLAIGGLVAVACFFLEKLLCKKVSAKLLVFAPFLLGAALYLAYGALFVGNVAENAGAFIQHGFSCGSFATAARVIVRQLAVKGQLSDRTALRAQCVREMLAPYCEIGEEEAKKIAELAETDEAGAKALVLSLCEGADEGAAELVIGALKDI